MLQDGASKIFALKPENLETEIERHARLGVEFSVEVTSDVLLARTVARGRDLLTEYSGLLEFTTFCERGETSLGFIEQTVKMMGPRGIRSADEDVLLRSMALNILEVRLRTLVLRSLQVEHFIYLRSPSLTFYLRLSLSCSLPAASYSSRWQV